MLRVKILLRRYMFSALTNRIIKVKKHDLYLKSNVTFGSNITKRKTVSSPALKTHLTKSHCFFSSYFVKEETINTTSITTKQMNKNKPITITFPLVN